MALMTRLWTVLNDCSSWSSPFLKHLCDFLHALLLFTLDHDLLMTLDVNVADDRGHRQLARKSHRRRCQHQPHAEPPG